jgi:hypothetical protein
LQSAVGFSWWALVSLVREATLGSLDHVVVAVFDIPLFAIAPAASGPPRW